MRESFVSVKAFCFASSVNSRYFIPYPDFASNITFSNTDSQLHITRISSYRHCDYAGSATTEEHFTECNNFYASFHRILIPLGKFVII